MESQKKILFPNLNGIRFIAAMIVVVHHIEQIKGVFGYPSFYRDNIYGTNLGGLGVTLFFVLSGFLITYLLLEEKDFTGTISLKKFYIRRVLRIWPLYYLIVFLSFLIIPVFFESLMILNSKEMLEHEYSKKLMMFLFFLPNVAFVTTVPVMFAAHLWSIGVEEQFYAIWPLLLKFFKRPVYFMVFIIVVSSILNLFLQMMINDTGEFWNSKYRVYLSFILVTRIDCMAVGGIIAWYSWRNNKYLKYLKHWSVQLFSYLILILLASNETVFAGLGHLPYAVLFGIIIYNLAFNKNTLVKLENKFINYGGKISYGIYMYQPLCIVLVFIAFTSLNLNYGGVFDNLILYSLSIIFTILVSAISYQLFEKYFLNKKNNFSTFVSVDFIKHSNKII